MKKIQDRPSEALSVFVSLGRSLRKQLLVVSHCSFFGRHAHACVCMFSPQVSLDKNFRFIRIKRIWFPESPKNAR